MLKVPQYERQVSLPSQGAVPPQNVLFDSGADVYKMQAAVAANVGQQMTEIGNRLYEQRSAAEMIAAKTMADRRVTDLLLRLQNEPYSEGGFEAAFNEERDKILDSVSSSFTSNGALQKFKNEFWPVFVENSRERIKTLEIQKETDYIKSTILTGVAQAKENNDLQAIDLILATGKGLIPDTELTQMRLSAQKDISVNLELGRMELALKAGKEWEITPEADKILDTQDTQILKNHWQELKDDQRMRMLRERQEVYDANNKAFTIRIASGDLPSTKELIDAIKTDKLTPEHGRMFINMVEAERKARALAAAAPSGVETPFGNLSVPLEQAMSVQNALSKKIFLAKDVSELMEIEKQINIYRGAKVLPSAFAKNLMVDISYKMQGKARANAVDYSNIDMYMNNAIEWLVNDKRAITPKEGARLRAGWISQRENVQDDPALMRKVALDLLTSVETSSIFSGKKKAVEKYRELQQIVDMISVGSAYDGAQVFISDAPTVTPKGGKQPSLSGNITSPDKSIMKKVGLQ